MTVEITAGCSVAETAVGAVVAVACEVHEVIINTEITNTKND